MSTNPPIIGNAPRQYSPQYFDLTWGALRSYFDRLRFASGGGSAAGSSGQVQYNDAGSFGASANLTVDTGTGALTTGVDATINGCLAGRGDGNDASNTVFGVGALGTTNTGQNNTVFGYGNMGVNTSGRNNTVVGNGCMTLNTEGTANVAIGSAMEQNETGEENIAIGWSTMNSLTTGSNNIAIGAGAGGDTVFTVTTQSNRIVMGNEFHTNAYIKIAWTVTSDARDKVVFDQPLPGLAFVSQLRPVAYKFRLHRDTTDTAGQLRYGFLAQDVQRLDTAGVVIDAQDPDNLKYNESAMVPILVRAIQELKARVEILEGML